MKVAFRLFVLAAIFVFLFSCKKKKITPSGELVSPVDLTDYEMLRITKPEWLIYKIDAGGSDLWIIPGFIQACMKDDTYRFYKDSVLTTYENVKVCNPGVDSTRSDWHFIDGRKKLEVNLLGVLDTATIVSLTDTSMNLFVNYNGADANVFFRKK